MLLLGHTGNAFGKHYIVEEKIQKKLLLRKKVSAQNKFEKQSGFKIILFDPITYLFDESQQVATKKTAFLCGILGILTKSNESSRCFF